MEETGCNDYAHGSECCGKIGQIPLVKKNDDYVCLNMTYKENGTVIRFHLTWNGDEKMSGELLDFKDDICASIPIPKIGPLIGICLFFTKYSRVSMLKSYTIAIQDILYILRKTTIQENNNFI